MIDLVRSLRNTASLSAGPEHRVMKHGHGFARRQDEGFVRQGRQLEPWSRGEVVRWRQCHNERLADDNLAVQRGVVNRRSHEAHIELTIEERRDLRRNRHRPGLDVDVLMVIVEGAAKRRDVELIGTTGSRASPHPRSALG